MSDYIISNADDPLQPTTKRYYCGGHLHHFYADRSKALRMDKVTAERVKHRLAFNGITASIEPAEVEPTKPKTYKTLTKK